jgi:hypothetical protein
MMLDADVVTIEPQSTVVAAARRMDMTLEDRFVIRLGVHMGVVAATAVRPGSTAPTPEEPRTARR